MFHGVPLPLRFARTTASGLVEITLAIGLVAFALVAILGTLPIGLAAIKDAATDTAEAHIVKACSAQALTTPFDQLGTALTGTANYFNYEGLPLAASAPASDRVYRTEYRLTPPVYPGALTSATNSLQTIQIVITSNTATNRHTIQLARQKN